MTCAPAYWCHSGRTTDSQLGHSAQIPVLPSSFLYSTSVQPTGIFPSQSGQCPSRLLSSVIYRGGGIYIFCHFINELVFFPPGHWQDYWWKISNNQLNTFYQKDYVRTATCRTLVAPSDCSSAIARETHGGGRHRVPALRPYSHHRGIRLPTVWPN